MIGEEIFFSIQIICKKDVDIKEIKEHIENALRETIMVMPSYDVKSIRVFLA